MRTYSIKITGIVQGVGMRFHALDEAGRLGIKGWVRNARDGSVEAVAQGDEDVVREFIESLRRGPGRVSQVVCNEISTNEEFGGYIIR